MQTLILAITVIPFLLILDALWIGLIAKGFYTSQLGSLLSSHPVWAAAILFYIVYGAALAFFVLVPALASRSLMRAILTGAFLGLAAFGTYDLTNLAATAGWPMSVTVVDMLYGMVASAIASGGAYLLATSVFGL